jgi:hypothetical protein
VVRVIAAVERTRVDGAAGCARPNGATDVKALLAPHADEVVERCFDAALAHGATNLVLADVAIDHQEASALPDDGVPPGASFTYRHRQVRERTLSLGLERAALLEDPDIIAVGAAYPATDAWGIPLSSAEWLAARTARPMLVVPPRADVRRDPVGQVTVLVEDWRSADAMVRRATDIARRRKSALRILVGRRERDRLQQRLSCREADAVAISVAGRTAPFASAVIASSKTSDLVIVAADTSRSCRAWRRRGAVLAAHCPIVVTDVR